MGVKKRRLKTLRFLYSEVFNHTTVGFVLVDKNGIIKDSNETFRKIFGYELKSDLGDKHVEICQVDANTTEKFQALSEYILSGNSVIEKEFQLKSKKGEKIWCEISGTLLSKDDRMKEGGILWDIVDIREKVKIRELFIKQHEELKELNNTLNERIQKGIEKLRSQDKLLAQQTKMAMMGEMIDAVAHQWKQPLSVIKLSADEMNLYSKDKTIDAEYLEIVSKRVESQVDHLVETIDEFRDFFRPKDVAKSENIKKVIDSSIRILKDELLKNTIETKITGNIKLCARLIPNEFKHIIINLVLNAKDQFKVHNINKKLITFKIEKDEEYIILKVKDNAGGIPKEYLSKIFEANFTTKKEKQGTGIGLYMTKNILEKIGATIEARNSKNGAQFIIRIPI